MSPTEAMQSLPICIACTTKGLDWIAAPIGTFKKAGKFKGNPILTPGKGLILLSFNLKCSHTAAAAAELVAVVPSAHVREEVRFRFLPPHACMKE